MRVQSILLASNFLYNQQLASAGEVEVANFRKFFKKAQYLMNTLYIKSFMVSMPSNPFLTTQIWTSLLPDYSGWVPHQIFMLELYTLLCPLYQIPHCGLIAPRSTCYDNMKALFFPYLISLLRFTDDSTLAKYYIKTSRQESSLILLIEGVFILRSEKIYICT